MGSATRATCFIICGRERERGRIVTGIAFQQHDEGSSANSCLAKLEHLDGLVFAMFFLALLVVIGICRFRCTYAALA